MSFWSLLSLFGAVAAATSSATTTSFCLTGLASTPTSTITTTTTTSTTTLSTLTVTSKITPVTTIVPPSQTVVQWKTVTKTSTLNLAKVTDVYYTYTSTSTFTQTNTYTANFNTTVVSTFTDSVTDAVIVPTPSGFTALGDQIMAMGYSTYGNSPYSSTKTYPDRRRNLAKRTTMVSQDPASSTATSVPQFPQYVICDEIVQILATSTVRSTASTTKTVSKAPKTTTKTSTIVITNVKTITPRHASTTISTFTSTTLTTQSTTSVTSTSVSSTTTTIFNPAATHFAICDSNNIVNSVEGQYDLYPYPDALTAHLGESPDLTPEDCCTLCALDPSCATSWLLPGESTNQCYAFYNQDGVCNPTGDAWPFAGELYIWDWTYGYSGTYVSNSNCGKWDFIGYWYY